MLSHCFLSVIMLFFLYIFLYSSLEEEARCTSDPHIHTHTPHIESLLYRDCYTLALTCQTLM